MTADLFCILMEHVCDSRWFDVIVELESQFFGPTFIGFTAADQKAGCQVRYDR